MATAMLRKASMELLSKKADRAGYGSGMLISRPHFVPTAATFQQGTLCGRSLRVGRRSPRDSRKTRNARKRQSVCANASSRQMRTARKALLCSLRALCGALAKASPIQRRSAIERLPMPLRLELIRVREAQQVDAATAKLMARRPRSGILSLRASFEDMREEMPSTPFEMHAPAQKRIPFSTGTFTRIVSKCTAVRPRGNVWTVKTAGGVYYRLRLTLGRVLITSGRLYSDDTARQFLAKLTAAATDRSFIMRESAARSPLNAEGHDVETRLHRLAAIGMTGNLELSFQVVLDVRRWLGHRIYSKPFASVEEVIATRRQVIEAERHGAWALCELWWDWAQAPWHTGGRARRLSSAEGTVALNAAKRRCLDVSQPIGGKYALRCRQPKRASGADARMAKTQKKTSDFGSGKRLFTCAERAKSALARVISAQSIHGSITVHACRNLAAESSRHVCKA